MLSKNRTKKPDLNNYLRENPKNNVIKKSGLQNDTKKLNQKNLNNFEKITGSGEINILGNNPVVMFKKQTNKKVSKSPNPLKSKITINKTKFEYLSDGGMSQKIQKYNSNNNLNKNKYNNNNNLYIYNNFISEKDKLPNNNNIKNNYNNNNLNKLKKQNEQKQLFSKTVREFNKRPNILNKENNNKETNSKTKHSYDEKRIKNNKTGIQNIKNSKQYKIINNEESKLQEEQKVMRMKKLVENGVVNEIKKFENKIKIQKKDANIERKKEVIENQGLTINYLFNEKDEEEEKRTDSQDSNNNEINNINYLQKQFLSKSTRGFYPKINNYFYSIEKNNDEENIDPLKEKRLKPSVNQFEFINKINNEKKKTKS